MPCRTTSPDSASGRLWATSGSTSATCTRSDPHGPHQDRDHPQRQPLSRCPPSRCHLPPQHRHRRRLPDRPRRSATCSASPQDGKQTARRVPGQGGRGPFGRSGRDQDLLRRRGLVRRRAQHRHSGGYTFFAGTRSDTFFFDYDGIKNLYDTSGGRNFTAPHLGGPSPWTGVDSNTEANVFSTVIELPTSELGGRPRSASGDDAACAEGGKLLHVDRAGHPPRSAASSTPTTPRRSSTPVSR